MHGDKQLVPNVWSVIFTNLEPCFLADVMRVSKIFNKAASSDIVFFNKFKQYFPKESTSTYDVYVLEPYKAKMLFRKAYEKKFASLKSSASRRLLSFLIEEDVDKIREFNVVGDQLYEMLMETDADYRTLMYYANQARNQNIRKELMNLFMKPLIAMEQSWNPLTIVAGKIRERNPDNFLKVRSDNTYLMVAALGDMEILKGLQHESARHFGTYRDALHHTIEYGHLEAFEFLMEIEEKFRVAGQYHIGHEQHCRPLTIAIRHRQLEIVMLILNSKNIPPTMADLRDGLENSTRRPEIFKVCLEAYLQHHDFNFAAEHHFLFSTLLHELTRSGDADLVDFYLKKTFDKMIVVRKNLINDFREHGNFHEEIKYALQYNKLDIINLLLTRLGNIEEAGFAKDFSPLFHKAVVKRNKNGVELLLQHGYVPNKLDIAAAADYPKMKAILESVIGKSEVRRLV